MFDIIVVRQLFHEVHNMCWCWKSTKKTGQFSWFAFGLDGRNTQISPAVRGPRSDVGGGGGGDDDDDDAKTAGATPQPPMRTTPSTTAAAAAMMPIRREGMAVCETCGAVGVKDTYYTRERRFCSQQVRVTELSTVEFSFVFSLFFSFLFFVAFDYLSIRSSSSYFSILVWFYRTHSILTLALGWPWLELITWVAKHFFLGET